MDTASLYQGLTFLAWTSVGFLVIVGACLVKVLLDISKLMKEVNKTASLIKDSAKPILADITESVGIINKFVKRTETNVNRFKNISGKLSKIALGMLSKTSTLSKLVFRGVFSIVKTLLKN